MFRAAIEGIDEEIAGVQPRADEALAVLKDLKQSADVRKAEYEQKIAALAIRDEGERAVALGALRLFVAHAREVHRPDSAQVAVGMIARLSLNRTLEGDEPWMGYTPGEDARPRGGHQTDG
jgi:hypothetical protein